MFFLKKARILRTRTFSPPVRFPDRGLKKKKVGVIGKRKEAPYLIEKGWRKFKDSYMGYFETDYGAWGGIIDESYFNNYVFYIVNPPKALKESSHWDCFRNKGNGTYSIHFSKKPEDMSSGILTIEKLITESFKNPPRRRKWF